MWRGPAGGGVVGPRGPPEAPIALHVANNVLLFTLNTIFADGGAWIIDRSAGAAGLSLLVFALVDVRLSGRRSRPRPGR